MSKTVAVRPPAEFSCNEVNNCDPNAECIWDGYRFTCECMDGFSGDGYSCSDSGNRALPSVTLTRLNRYKDEIETNKKSAN